MQQLPQLCFARDGPGDDQGRLLKAHSDALSTLQYRLRVKAQRNQEDY